MFKVTMSQSYTAEGTSKPVPSYSRVFDNLTKREVQYMEEAWVKDVMLAMGKQSADATDGKGPKMAITNPQTCTFSYRVEKDGVLWTAMQNVWPHWGKEAQAFFDGAMAGLFAKLSKIAAKENRTHGHNRK